MNLGIVITETWAFFEEVYDELARHHRTRLFHPRQTSLPFFQERFNRALGERDLRRFLSSSDVVFFEWASELLGAASQLPKVCGIVTRLHRYELYRWADGINWEAVDKVILVSRAKQREFMARYPQQAAKAIVIPEAVSLERFQPHPRAFGGHLGILCNLAPRKRVYELILAFYELNRREPGLHLHIGGGEHPLFPDYPHALQSLVSKLGLQDQVTFYGRVTRPEEWYSQIDIFISNSYSEGLQVSPMEAIAAGAYCLAHQWDGADELLPEASLYYTERELVEKVLEYCQAGEAERRARREALRAKVAEDFNVDRIKVQIRETIEQVAA
ncbi:MAG: glycosyltransferase family 4 protein [Anaerolineales bacterium]|nr:glycosyltransferase family 4 protein [Anaerolineales bacterium]